MIARPISLILAAGLLLLIGLSGMGVGGTLLGASPNMPVFPGAGQTMLMIGGGMAAYGFAATVAGVGLLLLRRWGWGLGLGIIAIGLAALGAMNLAIGALDSMLLFGIAVWGLTLLLLLAPSTRDAVRPPPARP